MRCLGGDINAFVDRAATQAAQQALGASAPLIFMRLVVQESVRQEALGPDFEVNAIPGMEADI